MRIFNIMMSKDLGGIQQAFVDYYDALTMQKNEVINITTIGADINKKVPNTYHCLPNITSWCIFSRIYLRILLAWHKPDIVICHGNRAISFATSLGLSQGNILRYQKPIIGISHTYNCKYLKKCDYVISLTNKLEKHLIDNGISSDRLLKIPNMVRVTHAYKEKPYSDIITIASFNRFIKNKGLIYLIEAFAILKKTNSNIRLLIGGAGPEKESFTSKINELKIKNDVTFYGWVKDKDNFFNLVDIFCLPSVIEPFGIILLEAIEYSKPVVTTKSGGPEETIRDNIDGLLADIESPQQLADKLQILVNNEELSRKFSQSAHQRLGQNYDIKIVSKNLSDSLKKILIK